MKDVFCCNGINMNYSLKTRVIGAASSFAVCKYRSKYPTQPWLNPLNKEGEEKVAVAPERVAAPNCHQETPTTALPPQ